MFCSLFQVFRWWGAGKKFVERGRKIDEGKNRMGKVSPRFFPCVSFCTRCIHDLIRSLPPERLEQAIFSDFRWSKLWLKDVLAVCMA